MSCDICSDTATISANQAIVNECNQKIESNKKDIEYYIKAIELYKSLVNDFINATSNLDCESRNLSLAIQDDVYLKKLEVVKEKSNKLKNLKIENDNSITEMENNKILLENEINELTIKRNNAQAIINSNPTVYCNCRNDK